MGTKSSRLGPLESQLGPSAGSVAGLSTAIFREPLSARRAATGAANPELPLPAARNRSPATLSGAAGAEPTARSSRTVTATRRPESNSQTTAAGRRGASEARFDPDAVSGGRRARPARSITATRNGTGRAASYYAGLLAATSRTRTTGCAAATRNRNESAADDCRGKSPIEAATGEATRAASAHGTWPG